MHKPVKYVPFYSSLWLVLHSVVQKCCHKHPDLNSKYQTCRLLFSDVKLSHNQDSESESLSSLTEVWDQISL